MQTTPMVMCIGHEQSFQCKGMYAARVKHAAAANSVEANNCIFSAYREELENVEVFKYLGRMVSADNNDTHAIRGNLKKAHNT